MRPEVGLGAVKSRLARPQYPYVLRFRKLGLYNGRMRLIHPLLLLLLTLLPLLLTDPAHAAPPKGKCNAGYQVGTDCGAVSFEGCCGTQNKVQFCQGPGVLCELDCIQSALALPPQSCCEAGSAAGCCDADIMKCVCAKDDLCCSGLFGWDQLCVLEVEQFGCGKCSAAWSCPAPPSFCGWDASGPQAFYNCSSAATVDPSGVHPATCGDGPCVPACTGKQCGPDGCGNTCGTCPGGATCDAGGLCVPVACVPKCSGKQCGSDGCGKECGTCGAGKACAPSGLCVSSCATQCAGKQCGSDGCGGQCGTCASGTHCGAAGLCEPDAPVCTPNCGGGKVCGPDGCNGSCGSCLPPAKCDLATGTCHDPNTCKPSCSGKACGPNGCGGVCGTCPDGVACQPEGTCGATPVEPAASPEPGGADAGPVVMPESVPVDPNSCPKGYIFSFGQCVKSDKLANLKGSTVDTSSGGPAGCGSSGRGSAPGIVLVLLLLQATTCRYSSWR